MTARDDAREGALFLMAGVLSGLGAYGFQILATRSLSAAEFAHFSGWLAHVSVGFVAAGLAQYAANFYPLGERRLIPALWLANGVAIVLFGLRLIADKNLGAATSLTVLGLAIISGWISGQTQIRLDYRGLGLSQVLAAAVKVVVPFLRLENDADAFALAVEASFLPVIWLLSWRLRRASGTPPNVPHRKWTGPILIALAANLIPQMDLILVRHTQTPSDFEAFARVSLFFKGIYFFVFIFAQWLLPRQIRGSASAWLGPGLVASFAGAASMGLTAVTPLVGHLIFHWDIIPARSLVLLSCLHMSLLTLLFVHIQSTCAEGRESRAVVLLGALALEATLQFVLAPPTLIYLGLAVGAQSVLVIWALRVPTPPRAC